MWCDVMISDNVKFVQEANHETTQDETKLRQKDKDNGIIDKLCIRYSLRTEDRSYSTEYHVHKSQDYDPGIWAQEARDWRPSHFI